MKIEHVPVTDYNWGMFMFATFAVAFHEMCIWDKCSFTQLCVWMFTRDVFIKLIGWGVSSSCILGYDQNNGNLENMAKEWFEYHGALE